MHDKNPAISVIVSTYNRPDTLRLVLLALNEQDANGFEVIVADDGSGDETHRQLEILHPKLSYKFNYVWQSDEGFRLSMIRNKAAAVATGEYLIFIDGDSVPLPSFIRYHRKLAEIGYFVSGNRVLLGKDFTIQVLQSDMAIYTWSIFHWFRPYFQRSYNRFSPFILLPCLPNWLRKLRTNKWRGIRGGNLAVWKKDLLIVNGFDEKYCGWGWEDSDFVVRLMRSGILRKDGNFAVPILHLWHVDNDLSNKQSNYTRLEETICSSNIRAERGIDKYLS